jgi:hypothetical protein
LDFDSWVLVVAPVMQLLAVGEIVAFFSSYDLVAFLLNELVDNNNK